jgi:hypothetical protein
VCVCGGGGGVTKQNITKISPIIRLFITKIMFLYLNEFYVNKTLSLQEKTSNLFSGLLCKT